MADQAPPGPFERSGSGAQHHAAHQDIGLVLLRCPGNMRSIRGRVQKAEGKIVVSNAEIGTNTRQQARLLDQIELVQPGQPVTKDFLVVAVPVRYIAPRTGCPYAGSATGHAHGAEPANIPGRPEIMMWARAGQVSLQGTHLT